MRRLRDQERMPHVGKERSALRHQAEMPCWTRWTARTTRLAEVSRHWASGFGFLPALKTHKRQLGSVLLPTVVATCPHPVTLGPEVLRLGEAVVRLTDVLHSTVGFE
jgi:hypothetical protein